MYTSYTSESVCSGHPDKICDQISDAILDEALKNDKHARVAVETLVGANICVLAGEVTAKNKINYEKIARATIADLGYKDESYGFSDTSPVEVHIHSQSSEIAQGVDAEGAGDQGMMYGYACRDTKNFMPMPIQIAHELAQKIDQARINKILPYLRPDGKTQVTIRYESGIPKKVESIVLAVPHSEDKKLEEVRTDLFKKVVQPVLVRYELDQAKMHYIVNGTGVWHRGGPASDTGVTGRKIVVDTYGGIGRIGGGAFSGKDPTKVDRSGAYATRYIAKNIVAHGLADRVEVRLAYFIGGKKPIMLEAETFGTEHATHKIIKDFMNRLIDPSVKGIIEKLDLLRPIYRKTATYGHFGRNEFPWEHISKTI